MLRSMNSPPDPHDDHLRRLLDQRATRADLHSRVPSLSEFSDTPSIYSHPFFSPQPANREVDTSSLASQSLSRSSPRPGRERNRLNELAVSMLDLDEDPRSSFASSSVYNDEEQNDYDENDEDDEPMPRMSLLGPKMRFHSKAPWELDEGIVMEDEAESDRSRDHPKNSFSPVQSLKTQKTSFESRRSQGKGSFESVSSQTSYSRGPLHALTHSSASSASLASPQSGPRTPFSISRVRSHSPSLAQSPLLLPTSSRSPPESYISSIHDVGPLDTNASVRSNSSRPSYSSTEEDPHPYSNPNHARSSSEQSYDTSDILPHLAFPAVPRSDSFATVTEAQYTKVLSRPQTPQSETPVLSAPHSPRSIIHRKEISSPISVHSTPIRPADISLPSDPSNLPGWTDRGAPPAFGLISLEEARAQRARTATVQAASTPSSTDPAFHFPTNESANGHSPSSGVASRARARSISAGARAKQAFSNIVSGTPVKVERRDSEPAVVLHSANSSPGGRGLKHKKSGFMRLFNGGKDDKSPPPPVPSLSDGYAAFNAQQSTQKSSKAPIHRIPVPALSPSLTGDDLTIYPSSTRRTHPPLSIKTSSPAAIGRPMPSSAVGPSFPARLGVPNQSIPQSAPANVTEFPALKLRPISTMFSAQFGDHLIPNNSLTSPNVDTPSSASPSTAVSPTTPVSLSRLGDKPAVVNEGDDQSTVIRALQDQIVSAKMAWQRHIWELEGQIRDLKEEVESLRASDSEGYCSSCGRGSRQHANESDPADGEIKSISVVNRPRARTGAGTSRFGSAV